MFNTNGFTAGAWAENLRASLPANMIPDWRAIIRVVRTNWSRWVQYEPHGVPGPKFWLAKPAILVFDNILPAGPALCTGLYVERGYAQHEAPPGSSGLEVMDPNWQWHRTLWGTEAGRKQFHSHLAGIREAVAVIRHSRGMDGTVVGAIALTEPEIYLQLGSMLAEIPPTRWIDLVIGTAPPLTRCLEMPNEVVADSRRVLIRAIQLHAVVTP